MIVEALGVFACVFTLALIGIGPALYAVSPGQKRVAYALGIAPALGLAIIGLIGFPLVRYIAPTRSWALPLAAFLVLVSLALVASDWRRNKEAYDFLAHWRLTACTLGFTLVCYVVLVSPLIFGGLQYAAFRTNPSDAFVHMSLAETYRTVQWPTLIGGVELSNSNINGVQRLAEASPTALFTARFLLAPLPAANRITLSWVAQWVGIPVHRFYYAYHLISLFVALFIALVIGDQIKPAGRLKYLAAAAVTLGFWARFILERDRAGEVNAIPLLLLAVLAWMQLEQQSLRAFSRSRLLLALACAVIVSFYPQLVPVIVIAFVCYYLVGLGLRRASGSSILYHGVTIILVVLLFALSGQIGFCLRLFLRFAAYAEEMPYQYTPRILQLIMQDGAAALWGLPPSTVLQPLPKVAQLPLRMVADGIGVIFTAALIVASTFAVRKSAASHERIVFSMLVGGLLPFAGYIGLNNLWAAGRSLTYVYPYFVFGVLVYTKTMDLHLTLPLRRLALAVIAVGLVAQCLSGLYVPFSEALGGSNVLGQVDTTRMEDYDLSPITEYLENASPQLLLVNVPRTSTWMFALYAMFEFSKYPSYFQSGIIVDNSTEFQNLWLESLTEAPDYAVVLKSVDYIGPKNLGRKVAETADLALYRITVKDVAVFNEEEALLRARESSKGVFPTLESG